MSSYDPARCPPAPPKPVLTHIGHVSLDDSDTSKGKGRVAGVESMGMPQRLLLTPGDEETISDYVVEEEDEPVSVPRR